MFYIIRPLSNTIILVGYKIYVFFEFCKKVFSIIISLLQSFNIFTKNCLLIFLFPNRVFSPFVCFTSIFKSFFIFFSRSNLVKKVKALLPILIPLLISSVRRAYELAEAMECRCYNGGKGRTKYRIMKYSARDLIATILTCSVLAGSVLIDVFYDKIMLLINIVI